MAEVIAPPAPPETPPAAGLPPAPEIPPAAPPVPPESVDGLPEFAQRMIHDLRTEAATNRTKATAAEQTRQQTMDAIAKALGLNGDDDPAKAAQTAAEERDAAKSVAKNLAVENAVLRMANKHGANPESLTDSRSFMRTLEAIDPDADDFAAQVDTAITAALEANPALKATPATPAPPARSGGPVGGGPAVAGQVTEDELKTMSPEQTEQAYKEGRLTALLSKRAVEEDAE